MTASQAHYLAASRYIGLREASGPDSHPLIRKWIAGGADWLDPDDSRTAWCGCFRGALGLQCGTGVPKAHYRALSWATWGKGVDIKQPEIWEQGDTVILSRDGGAHVALLHRVVGANVELLGGNQSDSVRISSFPRSAVLAVRR